MHKEEEEEEEEKKVIESNEVEDNFHPVKIEIDGDIWISAGHYIVAVKCPGKKEMIMKKKNIGKLQMMTAENKEEWLNVRNDVIRRALVAKFTQH